MAIVKFSQIIMNRKGKESGQKAVELERKIYKAKQRNRRRKKWKYAPNNPKNNY